jgi:hypothetical protein
MNKIGAVLLQHLQALKMVCCKPSQRCAGPDMTGGNENEKDLRTVQMISRCAPLLGV